MIDTRALQRGLIYSYKYSDMIVSIAMSIGLFFIMRRATTPTDIRWGCVIRKTCGVTC